MTDKKEQARKLLGPPLVYIAGPFTAHDRPGVERNIERAVVAGMHVARFGACPIIPHANTGDPEFEKMQPYQFWIDATMAMLYRCDAVLMVDGWEHSGGATKERAEAERIGMPVFYSSTMGELHEWIQAFTRST